MHPPTTIHIQYNIFIGENVNGACPQNLTPQCQDAAVRFLGVINF